MKNLTDYALVDLKLIYSVLHNQVLDQPGLMDSELLHDLQVFLQQQAKQDGIDVSAHIEWAAWLNKPSS